MTVLPPRSMSDRLARFTVAAVVLAVVLSVASVVLVIRGPDPFEPLSGVAVHVENEVLHVGDTATVILSGCVEQGVIIDLRSSWVSPVALTVLGPGGVTEIESGCIRIPVQVEVPTLDPGLWRLAVDVVASDGQHSQFVRASSQEVMVVP